MWENIEVFLDTAERVREDSRLAERTRRAREETKRYAEGFISQKMPRIPDGRVEFAETLTLIPALQAARSGMRTAVLNFANPIEPGGGVKRGANAQEEYLCRASNLYFCLSDERVRPFYEAHRAQVQGDFAVKALLATDAVIYTPGVTFFREDVGYLPGDAENRARQVYTEDWAQVDVLTCAAPYFRSSLYRLPREELYPLFVRRIRQIFEVAVDNGVQALVLGAFGCGAFCNDAHMVAEAFREVLLEPRYRHAFERVLFAVRRSGQSCENIEAFSRCFSQFPAVWPQ